MTDAPPDIGKRSLDLEAVRRQIDDADLVIETRSLVKRYATLTAVKDLSLSVPRGAIYGFAGPNGAGKTSTMRILTTLMRPTSGQAFIAGTEVTKDPRTVRRQIGFMPDYFGVYDDMKVWEYLDFFAACYDISDAERPTMIADLLDLVDLTHRKDDMVDKLSRGLQQRLCLARTLVHDPQVLILDEPASGLDPRARIEIRELLVELARMGKTIFFSTHILADVAEICTHIGIIEAGEMVLQGRMDDVRRRLMPNRQAVITFLDRADEAKVALGKIMGVLDVQEIVEEAGRKRLRVHFDGDDTILSTMMQTLAAQAIPVVNFAEESEDLESVFLKVTKGIVS
ncbi:MAG TPA: ABC transporter ATP-binding protein [Aggregatilineales bacterium]|nr:ABC transporter ATP-binding protein [Anaerolineales bacterium]HRE48693.1 ABC transporter ATP-binding protein [Aggregatilineales bacterium]